ncbi:MAG: DUF4159 domain-containing protein [Ignavibacteria bacterium]|nr:DUF4159 domain-containing protein [Ignavibacteria bacterium]
MNKIFRIVLLLVIFLAGVLSAQSAGFQIIRLKFGGGSDWYNDPSADVNLMRFLQKNTNLKVIPEYKFVDLASDDIFNFPFLFMTGHGNVNFTRQEVERLRKYLENGGFLYIDDDYGLDKALRREMKKVFPDQDFAELPFSHPMYHILFNFPAGPPKTHRHDDKPPQGLGLFVKNRLCVYYTFESNPSDGWADPDVHHDPEEKRLEALKFGANIVLFSLTQ